MALLANTCVIAFEGSIGAGKTTLLKRLEGEPFLKEHVVMYEPVDLWMNLKVDGNDESLFKQYYNKPKEYGFVFQMCALQTRYEHFIEFINSHQNKLILCERSPLTDYKIFSKMLHDRGILSNEQFFVYKMWYNFMDKLIQPQIKAVVYLRVDPEVCVKRILKRNRDGEEAIDLRYLRDLHNYHERWLMEPNQHDVHVVDGNGSEIDLESLKAFINKKSTA